MLRSFHTLNTSAASGGTRCFNKSPLFHLTLPSLKVYNKRRRVLPLEFPTRLAISSGLPDESSRDIQLMV